MWWTGKVNTVEKQVKKSCDPGLCLRGVYCVFEGERKQATDEERPHDPMRLNSFILI